jgi:hypothetical protein
MDFYFILGMIQNYQFYIFSNIIYIFLFIKSIHMFVIYLWNKSEKSHWKLVVIILEVCQTFLIIFTDFILFFDYSTRLRVLFKIILNVF